MHRETNIEQGAGGFEDVQEEVMTYAISEQIPSPPLHSFHNRKHPKNHERHRLELLNADNQLFPSFNVREANKNMRRIECGLGKIIPIGHAIFKSNFECGNISAVKLTGISTYQIELERETNSTRRSAWFFFSVEGLKGEASFVIQGFKKSSSLYNEGMKVCYRDVKQKGIWRRGGNHITYTNTVSEDGEEDIGYELRFSHIFRQNQQSCIQFAYCFPYGLRSLYHLISSFPKEIHCASLGKSFIGQNIPLLTIGNANSENVIVLSARVHPGETVSSFIMDGFIRQLLGDNDFGQLLRTHFLFKIVPMLNPDGVIKGNYRFSGYGCDLNRKWRSCKPNYQPQIYLMRELLRSLKVQKKVCMYIDIHGHSRKRNVFFYGCCDKGDSTNIKPRTFPYLMGKIHEAFKYQNCCFSVQRDKQGTARITAWRELKIDYVYTLQASFCGSEHGPNYLEMDYDRIGRKLCQGMAVLFYSQIQTLKTSIPFKSLQRLSVLKQKALEQLTGNPQLQKVGEFDDSGSESEPEVGEISQKDRNPQNGLPKHYVYSKEALLNIQKKAKKQTVSSNFFSPESAKGFSAFKIKSEVSFGDQIGKINISAKQRDREKRSERTIAIQDLAPKFEKVEIKIANSINTFELDALKASSLYQKQIRVHSLTRNNDRPSERSQSIAIPLVTEATQHEREEQRIKINLMHSKQGAQYRRVRKMAMQNIKRQNIEIEQSNYMVKELHCNQIQMGKARTPQRFYPLSQQRNRKMSVQASMRKQNAIHSQFKRLSINGDEFKVRCQGRQIYL